ncbi:putative aminotransferase class-v [Rosellinia necatrix]|uniref:Putative aminotransferase class-v n=1 Tax=Rosellinia necatrix TaxID=77044 RepID=A0A1S7UJS9_ROSNE|nr:putative aminotransferase class-v [Rosellinia necatrix]
MSNPDIEAVRAQFPALSGDQVFFDNAGGSQTLGTVIEAIRDYLLRTNVQLGASYKTSSLSTERYNAGFAAGARYINAEESEIVFGASTTQLLRNVSFALEFSEGDEIVVSSIDHEANIAPWVDLAARQRLVLRWWTPSLSAPPSSPTDPRLLPSSLAPLLTPRTRLVACTHASNVLGGIHPVAAVAAAVRAGPSPDALLAVDGVSYAPHRPVDVRALGVDLYAFSWYKVYGPHLAMLYAGPRAQRRMRSLGHFFKEGVTLEEKIGLAGASYELLHAIPAVTAYLGGGGGGGAPSHWPAAAAQEEALQRRLLAYLAGARRPDVTVYGDVTGDPAARVATVSFRVRGWSSRDVVAAVEAGGGRGGGGGGGGDGGGTPLFGFRWGAFYSERLVADLLGLGADGVVRVSLAHYNTLEEVDAFIDAMEKYVPNKEQIGIAE